MYIHISLRGVYSNLAMKYIHIHISISEIYSYIFQGVYSNLALKYIHIYLYLRYIHISFRGSHRDPEQLLLDPYNAKILKNWNISEKGRSH